MRACRLLAVGCLLPALAMAQAPSASSPPRPRLVLVLEGNLPTGNPMAEVAARMVEAGYNNTSARECFFLFCSGPTRHPNRTRGGGTGIALRWTHSDMVSAGVGATFMSLGSVTGLDRYGEYISSSWRSDGAWSAVYWTPHAALRFGAGPAWFIHSSPNQSGFSQAGYVLEAGASGLTQRRLSLQIGARAYRMARRAVPPGGDMPLAVLANWSRTDLLGQLVWRF